MVLKTVCYALQQGNEIIERSRLNQVDWVSYFGGYCILLPSRVVRVTACWKHPSQNTSVKTVLYRMTPQWERQSHSYVTRMAFLPRILQSCETEQLRLYLWRRWCPRHIDVIFLRCILGHGWFDKSGGTACSYLNDTAKQVWINVSYCCRKWANIWRVFVTTTASKLFYSYSIR